MARVLSPLVVAVMLLWLALSAAGASLPTGTSVINQAVSSLVAAQPLTLQESPEVVLAVPILPSTSTADTVSVLVGVGLLAAGCAFILSVRRRMS
jgi:LPXTG-motif cell wall-anchored protein